MGVSTRGTACSALLLTGCPGDASALVLAGQASDGLLRVLLLLLLLLLLLVLVTPWGTCGSTAAIQQSGVELSRKLLLLLLLLLPL
jgi:hypothetical protein